MLAWPKKRKTELDAPQVTVVKRGFRWPLRWRSNTESDMVVALGVQRDLSIVEREHAIAAAVEKAREDERSKYLTADYDTNVVCPWCANVHMERLVTGREYTQACSCGCQYDYGTFKGRLILHTRPIQPKA